MSDDLPVDNDRILTARILCDLLWLKEKVLANQLMLKSLGAKEPSPDDLVKIKAFKHDDATHFKNKKEPSPDLSLMGGPQTCDPT